MLLLQVADRIQHIVHTVGLLVCLALLHGCVGSSHSRAPALRRLFLLARLFWQLMRMLLFHLAMQASLSFKIRFTLSCC